MEAAKLEQFKDLLEEKKSLLVARMDALAKEKQRPDGPISLDQDDQCLDVENDEVVDHLEGMDMGELKKVENALLRIANGHYGYCAKCEEPIPENRLKAVPAAVVCLNCQE